MIVIATNVAETSITIPGIRLVSTVCAVPCHVTACWLSRVAPDRVTHPHRVLPRSLY